MALQEVEYDRQLSSSPLSSVSSQAVGKVKDEDDCSERSLQSPLLSPVSPQRSFDLPSEPKKLHIEPQRKRPSFLIDDILNNDYSCCKKPKRIVRPWDLPSNQTVCLEKLPRSKCEKISSKCQKGSPLDALLKLANKTFEGLEKTDGRIGTTSPTSNSNNGASSNSKKKRKSRTAFTNHQVYELEKRFLYQKYLSPADRDEIAQSLGLTNAQVITWFQNRRAKLKRDIEESKKDVTATRIHVLQKSLYDNVCDIALLRAKYMDGVAVKRHIN